MKTTYIVSGYMRTGTSMMMDALTAGGLNPCAKVKRDMALGKHAGGGYHPNPNGFYELEHSDYKDINFPRKFEGQLIKVLFGGLYKLVPGNYKIVFMRRNQEESRQSYEAFFGQPSPKIVGDIYHKHPSGSTGPMTIDQLNAAHQSSHFKQIMDNCFGIMEQRRDVDITQLNYRDVVENPLKIFQILNQTGWPIDPVKAAGVVDPDLCRFKIEDLEIGI